VCAGLLTAAFPPAPAQQEALEALIAEGKVKRGDLQESTMQGLKGAQAALAARRRRPLPLHTASHHTAAAAPQTCPATRPTT
jgi:hypothetical protein